MVVVCVCVSVGDSGSALKQASDGLDRVKAAAQSITSVLGKIALTSAEMIAPSADLTSSSSLSTADRCLPPLLAPPCPCPCPC